MNKKQTKQISNINPNILDNLTIQLNNDRIITTDYVDLEQAIEKCTNIKFVYAHRDLFNQYNKQLKEFLTIVKEDDMDKQYIEEQKEYRLPPILIHEEFFNLLLESHRILKNNHIHIKDLNYLASVINLDPAPIQKPQKRDKGIIDMAIFNKLKQKYLRQLKTQSKELEENSVVAKIATTAR